MRKTRSVSPFRFDRSERGPIGTAIFGAAAGALEKMLGLARLDELYEGVAGEPDLDAFLRRALEALGCGWQCDPADLARVPAHGPLIVVANHPFGAIDGLLLAGLLRKVRSDTRIIANRLLVRIPELRELFFPVDAFGGKDAVSGNLRPLRLALRWLRDGHVLGVFPAGEVSHLQVARATVADPQWGTTVARLARSTGAAVLPVHFAGRNSLWFHVAGLIHPRLRTALLPREAAAMQGRTIRVRVAAPLPPETVQRFASDADLTAHLRLRTYALADEREPEALRDQAPLAPRPELPHLLSDLARLPQGQWLVAAGNLRVGIARAWQIPDLLREIGRLRELTFRLAGEGTGSCTDLDRFDEHYLHLFCWDQEQERLVGAYRLGPTDEILEKLGPRGLYTTTLFRMRREFLATVTPGLELGRSFVAPEYRRTATALLLLWRGIGEFVAQQPRYRLLFGPVSISDRYSPASRRLIFEHLRAHAFDASLARLVRPRRAFASSAVPGVDRPTAARAVADLRTLGLAVSAAEPDGSGVPVLVREYLKLGGRMLGFHVDRSFGDSLDALVLVDLLRTEPRLLARYLGAEGAARFLGHWSSTSVA